MSTPNPYLDRHCRKERRAYAVINCPRDLSPAQRSARAEVNLHSAIPYGCLYAATPVTFQYKLDFRVHTIDGLEFTIFLRGGNDYALDHSGPRTVYLLLKRGSKPLPDAFRVLDIQATSSTGTPIAAHTPGALPADVPFTQSGSLRYASWKGDQNFNPDLAAGEIITVTARVEITRDAGPTTHTVTVTFTPERIHRPISGLFPQV